MNTRDLTETMGTLFAELVNGVEKSGMAYMLNSGDLGLLRSLSTLSAAEASNRSNDGATIAAHVDHLRYGLSLMNRWANGEPNPFKTADWSQSWKIGAVSDAEWAKLRAQLADECERWLAALRAAREVNVIELNGVVGSIAHLAYHLGAIRQIDRSTRGPTDPGPAATNS